MEILNQLGGLVLGSVPTMILFVLLVIAYTVLVQGPLQRTLAERQARTSGAVEQARGAISAAEAETAVYEDKLRTARAELAAMREERRKQWLAERDEAVNAARGASQAKVRSARAEIDASAEGARRQIEGATAQLSESILRAVLPPGANITEAHQ
jgi:F-type H+-transporting ATPase subunit b